MINEPLKNDWKKWTNKCVICHKEIKFNKEKYVRLTDFDGKKEVSYCHYHLNCWLNRFQITQMQMNNMANMWMDKLTNSISNITGAKPEKVFEIK